MARGTTTKSAFDRATASRSSECHSVPTPLTRIATGIGQSLATASTAASRARRLVLGLHRIFEVEHDEVGAGLARLGDRARVRGRQEQQRPHGEQVDALVVFRFRYGHGRRIMPRNREAGEEEC